MTLRSATTSAAPFTRRQFMQALGTGLLIAASPLSTRGQAAGGRRGGGGFAGSPAGPISARIHIARDGAITLLSGKVECGQGARAELTQAAAEELRIAVEKVTLILADTDLVPDDGMTAGSRTTPSTVPAVRQAAAAARAMLTRFAARRWGVNAAEVQVQDAKAVHPARHETLGYADLAADAEAIREFAQAPPPGTTVKGVGEWKVLGTAVRRPNGRDLVTGSHHYPSDIVLADMLHAKVLRPPAYGAKPTSVVAEKSRDMAVVHDGDLIAVAAPTTFLAERAIAELSATVTWDAAGHVSSRDLFPHLKKTARGLPANPFAADAVGAAHVLRQSYTVAYVQHAPMEPRAAVAQWKDDKLTVWTSTQNPFGVRRELATTFKLPESAVRVIVPDFGGGFGGKHSGEAAIEAARIAKVVGKPICLRWTRAEEFTWAYFRPAGLIEVEAALDDRGAIKFWHFVNINSGPSSVQTPYKIANAHCKFVPADGPLRQGSYRGLAATANTFARECAMDELAEMAGRDPLDFRMAHLEDPRLRAVLEAAADKFNWPALSKKKQPNAGVGLSCGAEKGSYVAACAEVSIDPDTGAISVQKVCQAFECGAIVNPDNLKAQVQGAITMGLGPALREQVEFKNGKVTNASFARYAIPRMGDMPELNVHLIDRRDLPSSGAGETPIIAIAPAVANAVSRAIGRRVRDMPIRLPQA